MKFKINISFVVRWLYLAQFVLAFPCWAGDVDIESALQKSQRWVTVVYSKNEHLKGILVVDPPKKWQLARENESLYLSEISRNSLAIAPEFCLHPSPITGPEVLSKITTLISRRIKVGEVETSDFDSDVSKIFSTPCVAKKNPEDYRLNAYDNGSFSIHFRTSKKFVLFIPADQLPATAMITTPVTDRRTQILRAPLGTMEEAFRIAYKQKPNPTSYLHHDLTKRMEVIIDPGFPREFRAAVTQSIQEWNRSLRKAYFLRPRIEKVNVDRCISERKICFEWGGRAQVTVRGMSCQAQYGFDPSTGLILGGVIPCWSPKAEAKPLEPSLVARLESSTGDMKELVELATGDSALLENKLHPFPNILLSHLMVHEIGHFFGFGHNFKASTSASFAEPAPSVMDYYPAALVSLKTTRLGRFDKNLLLHIYHGQPIAPDYVYCSDAEAMPGLFPNSGLAKTAGCDQLDFGEPLEWTWQKIKLTGGLMGATENLLGDTVPNVILLKPYGLDPIFRHRTEAILCSAHLTAEEARLLGANQMYPVCH